MKVMCFILAVFVLVFTVQGAVYYVSKGGSDSNAGTEAQPWLTIQKAANTASAGDTVYIKSGAYNERVIVQNSGTAGNYITFAAYSNDTVTIDGTGINLPYDWGGLLDIYERSYIKISGLRVINAGPNDNNCGILVDESSYIILENNYTYNTTSSGIGVWGSSNIIIDGNEVVLACNDGEQECLTVAVTDTFEIKNNHVHHGGPGSNGAEGLDGKDGSRNGKIFNNHVHHMNRLGIYLDAWDKHTYNIDVYNNVVHDCVGDGITLASESGGLLEDIVIYNNLLYNNSENGVAVTRNGYPVTHPMKDIIIINNTMYKNGSVDWGGGIMLDNPDIHNLVVRNNILSQNVFYSLYMDQGVPMQQVTADYNLIHGFRNYDDEIRGSNYVEGDPLFVNAAAANFQLQSNSPAIDQGSSTSAPSKDYAGNSRPQGSGIDIGAYEYTSAGGGGNEPEISLSPAVIDVTVILGSAPLTRTFTVSNSGSGTLDWSAADNASWLSASPTGGTAPTTVTVTITPTGLSTGGYTGTVTVSAGSASNSPQTVTVNLTVTSSANDQEPFGHFDTPVQGATVRSSIAVTGWALDDVAVESVKIYRNPVANEGNDNIYIGDADFVDGARPDVQSQYPGYPNSSRAGWGYMLLTNFLPGNGNGAFTLYAVAKDGAGHSVTLGSKTITCDNANAVKPFGAIDTPTQGGTASGGKFINWGWVLTPQPNSIPTNGSTIHVWVDGKKTGNPTYNIYRSDIAGLFPGYVNSSGAVGYFYLDTTVYDNGVHTIQWTAGDSGGNSDGIGSRYFTIQNTGSRPSARRSKIDTNDFRDLPRWDGAVAVRKGFDGETPSRLVKADRKGFIRIRTAELERLVIDFLQPVADVAPSPIGSHLDRERGIFYWQPGPGFLNRHILEFILPGPGGKRFKAPVHIYITPYRERSAYLLNTMYPSPSVKKK
jgi:hypothetical protein